MPSLRWLAPLALTAACSAPTEPREPLARIDLRAATGRADVRAVGVAIDPSGFRTVLDEEAGLYRVEADGSARVLVALADLPDPGVVIRPPWTDLVALGPDRFAMTAIGDGFLLDVAAHTMSRHFCYEPGGFPEDQEQRTNALALDAATGTLYAQPRTFDLERQVLRSEIGMYAASSGLDLNWWSLPTDFDAGGMAALGGNRLLFGAGPRLHVYDLTREELTPASHLGGYGVTAIEGLAIDPEASTLLVLDGARDELVEIAISDLSL